MTRHNRNKQLYRESNNNLFAGNRATTRPSKEDRALGDLRKKIDAARMAAELEAELKEVWD